MRVIPNQMRLRIKSHQRRPAARIGKKHIEQRPQLRHLVELENTHSALLHRHHQRNRRRIHLLLHMNLLRHPVILDEKVLPLEPVHNPAATLLHQRRHQDLVGRNPQGRRV